MFKSYCNTVCYTGACTSKQLGLRGLTTLARTIAQVLGSSLLLPPGPAMLVGFRYGDQHAELTVEKDTQLRHVQQDLCRLFGQRFPSTKAKLQVSGTTYDDYGDTPFLHCCEDEARWYCA